MDAKSLKYIFVLFFLILDSGRVRESFAEACLFKEECSDDEYCDESSRLCIKLVARDSIRSETPLYQRNQPQEEWTDQGYDSYQKDYEQNDPEESQEHQTGRGTRWESSENEDDYNDRNLRQPMQGRDSRQDQRVTDDGHGPLPPVVGTGWDKIGAGHGKDRVNLRYDVRRHQRKYDQREFEDYDENFPAKRHLRQREESAIDAMTDDETDNIRRTNGNGDFSNLDNVEAVDRGARDSIKFNQDSSSEGSQRLTDSETSSEKLPLDESRSAKSFPNNERRIPPVPLQGDERPIPSDNSASRGNQMQTEKQAGEIASMKNAGPAGKGKVMVKGKVQQIKDDIDQGPNPEKTYKRVEDFFETQRESSIVEVPNAVKKEEETKLFKDNFVPVDKHSRDEVDKEEAASPTHDEGDIKLSLNRIVDDSKVKLKMARTDYTLEEPNYVAERIRKEPSVRGDVARNSGIHIVGADYEDISSKDVKGHPKRSVEAQQPKYFLITIIVVGCVTGVVLTAVAIYLIMKRYNETKNFKPVTLPGQEAAADYQELCRQLRATQGWDSGPVKTTHLQQGDNDKGLGSGRAPKYSWSEEPVVPNMDISTGHVVLAYMEDHLNNKDRLNKEWEALKTYEAEPNSREIGKLEKNARKNRYSDVLPYDHNRVLLKETASATGSDYINGSYITDHDPKNPAYIATQGPLAHTVSDFWQMVWEQGVVVIVNLTKLSDLGLPQCHRYWPEEQQPIITYRIYEVHLVSEHIWCEDYLVRSFYLKNLQTSETRTVTQFHFLSWPDLNVPSTPKPLLEFRRKVNKCFRGRASPVIVHCSGGVGRTGTYILIDMVLNKMMRGAKEIDIAATVEHLRDQRPSMVKTKAQFEFALTAVAEEVNAILQALSK